MMLADTNRRRLHARALDQYGYITTADAAELGVPAVELRKIAHRGGLTHLAHGLYRFDDIPAGDHGRYLEAVLRAGPGAYLAGDAVLAFHDLALVNPRRIRVAAPRRVRAKLPDWVAVEQRPPGRDDVVTVDGVPMTRVAQALRECQGTVMADRLADAAGEAVRRGLVRRREAAGLLAEINTAA